MTHHDPIVGRTMNDLYREAIWTVLEYGSHAGPRGQGTTELVGAKLVLTNPDFNVLTQPARGLNYPFMVAEWLWIMSGSNSAELVAPFNRSMGMARDEGSWAFTGAYGPKIIEQLPYVLESLRADGDTRQAVVSIWRERPRASRDVPCTLSFQFLLRDGALHMVTTMRSNDAWLGLPYDAFAFTQLQRLLAAWLGAGVGEYVHNAGSFHLYDRDRERAEALLEERSDFTPLVQLPFAQDSRWQLERCVGLFWDLASAMGGFEDAGTKKWYGKNPAVEAYVSEWWRRASEPGMLAKEWRDYMAVLARRFSPSVDPSDRWSGLLSRSAR